MEKLEVKLKEKFEVKSLKLPMCRDTHRLIAKIDIPEEFRLVRELTKGQHEDGTMYPHTYELEANKIGEYQLDLYFVNMFTNEKSDLYQQKINVKVTD